MSTDKSKIPADRRGVVTPHLIVSNAKEAHELYKKAFGAQVLRVSIAPNSDRVMHSEVKVFNSILYVVDDFPEWRGGKEHHPRALGGTPVVLNFAVDDVDAVHEEAVKAGLTSQMAPKDQFWGDRYCHLADPFGHEWAFLTPLKGGPESWPKMDFGGEGGEEHHKKAKH